MFKPFARYADFNGRSRRSEYWLWMLLNTIVYGALFIWMFFMMYSSICGLAQRAANGEFDNYAGPMGRIECNGAAFMVPADQVLGMFAVGGIPFILLMIWGLITFIPTLAVQIRRLHDQDNSGWFILIPLVNFILIGFIGGTPGPNRFGPNPRGF